MASPASSRLVLGGFVGAGALIATVLATLDPPASSPRPLLAIPRTAGSSEAAPTPSTAVSAVPSVPPTARADAVRAVQAVPRYASLHADGDCLVANEGDGIPAFEGRALSPSGRPLARQRLVAILTAESDGEVHELQRETFTSERDGRFIVGFEPVADTALVWRLELRDRDGDDRPRVGAVLELDPTLLSGLTHLGDVRLEPPRALAAGRTVAPDRAYVPQAAVRAWRPTGGELRLAEGPWILDAGLTVGSDERGFFEVRGWGDAPRLGLQGVKAGYTRVEPAPVAAGARDVRLRLEPLATLAGCLLVPAGVDLPLWEVRLTPLDAASTRGPTAVRPTTPDWRFAWRGLAPGDWQLEVAFVGADRPLVVLPVHLRPGRAANAGLCDPVDVRWSASVFPLVVLDPAGLPVTGGFAVPRTDELEPEPVRLPERFPVRGGRALVITTRPSVDVDVRVPGHRAALVEDLCGEATVRLADGIEVELVLTDPAVVPRAPFALRADLEPTAPTASLARGSLRDLATFDATGAQRLRVPGPGRYRVRWRLLEEDERTCRARPLGGAPEVLVEISGPGPARLELTLPAESTLPYR